ncbi:MAG TPA: NADP-specific glutamate dehydrogenase, partial [Acholeplasmataceae bacterium]|nr:NADP-specific glutamate dehydrogenase [Acholeplasmataceae bacterium]
MLKSEYLTTVYKKLENKHPTEQEFLQSVYSFFDTISDYVSENDYIEKNGVIERLVVPERIITFRVPWVDDLGKVQVNYGYRVEFNSSLGPYKGGLRFHPTVNESLLKFLAFEQTFKNALTGLPLGGGKGGSDFDPKDKSENEIMRFCHSFMAELYRYIGPNTDVPAGDIGVGAREIGYLFGYYKKLKNEFTGAITGKGVNYGGSLVRKEATGYGLCYFTEEALKSYLNTTFKDKKVIISGSGNVALYTAIKAYELGGKVIAMSDIDGYIYDEEGLDIEYLRKIKEEERKPIKEYTVKYPLTKYNDNSKKIWEIPCDIALPCATQNELDLESVKALVSNGVIAVCEGANKPIIPEGIKYLLNNKIVYGPCIAAN